MDELTENKKLLRKRIKALKSELTEEMRAIANAQIASQIESLPAFKNSKEIVAYWAMPDEVSLNHAIERWAKEKNVYLPIVKGEKLEFRKFTNSEELNSENKYGIGEPVSGELLRDESQVKFMLIPGIAFTCDGKRLGRGGGYYDRIASQFGNAYKCGVAFDCQIVDTIPMEPHDMITDIVIHA